MNKLDCFENILELFGQAGWAHLVFTLLFDIGLVAILTKNTGMSKAQGVFWIGESFGIHFIFNSPFNKGIFQTVFPI
ncbi:PrsW family intramembrane metalloprotease, partial [Streptococcus suis]